MKNRTILLIFCLAILPVCLFADDKPFRINDRTIEFGLNLDVGFTNDFLSTNDIFQETFVIDLDELEDGFKMNIGGFATPLYFSFNANRFGFGLSFNADAFGIFNLSGRMLSFDEIIDDKSDVGGAAYADVSIPLFFKLSKFKIKVTPALYFPLAYAKSDVSYTFHNDNPDGSVLHLVYDLDVHVPIEPEDSGFTSRPGVDFHLGVEYSLLKSFDIGLDLFGIPLLAASMEDYMKFTGTIGNNEPFTFFGDDVDMESFISFDDRVDAKEKISVIRPFKMLAWVNWRLLEIPVFTLTVKPVFGFAINPVYNETFSIEAGLRASFDIANLFITTIGTGYHDRIWKNSIALAINLRAVELNIGADLRAPDFADSWNGSGFGMNVGLKFGW